MSHTVHHFMWCRDVGSIQWKGYKRNQRKKKSKFLYNTWQITKQKKYVCLFVCLFVYISDNDMGENNSNKIFFCFPLIKSDKAKFARMGQVKQNKTRENSLVSIMRKLEIIFPLCIYIVFFSFPLPHDM